MVYTRDEVVGLLQVFYINVEETGELYLGTGDRGGDLQFAYLLPCQESQSILCIGMSILTTIQSERIK